MKESEISWAAGLFEGEGCLLISTPEPGKRRHGCARAQLTMTDEDVVRKFHAILGFGIFRGPFKDPKLPAHHKVKYQWRTDRLGEIRTLIEGFSPWLGERRMAKAQELLRHIDEATGVGGFNRTKTHCLRNHEFTEANTYHNVSRGRPCRVCRTCQRDRMANARLTAQ